MTEKYYRGEGGVVLLWTVLTLSLLLMIVSFLTIIVLSEMKQATQIDESAQAYMAAEAGYERALNYANNETEIATTGCASEDLPGGTDCQVKYEIAVVKSEGLPGREFDQPSRYCINEHGVDYCLYSIGRSGVSVRKLAGEVDLIDGGQNGATFDLLNNWNSDSRVFPSPGGDVSSNPPPEDDFHFGYCNFDLWFTENYLPIGHSPEYGDHPYAPKTCDLLKYVHMLPDEYNLGATPPGHTPTAADSDTVADPSTVVLQNTVYIPAMEEIAEVRPITSAHDGSPSYSWGLFDSDAGSKYHEGHWDEVWGRGLSIWLFDCNFYDNSWCETIGKKGHVLANVWSTNILPNEPGFGRMGSMEGLIHGTRTDNIDLGDSSTPGERKLRFTLTYKRGNPNTNEHTATLKVVDITDLQHQKCLGVSTMQWKDDMANPPFDAYFLNGYENWHNGYTKQPELFSGPSDPEMNDSLVLYNASCPQPDDDGKCSEDLQPPIYLKDLYLQAY